MDSQENIKPNISTFEVPRILERTFGFKASFYKPLVGYDDLNFHCRGIISYNPFENGQWPDGYVLKIMNSLDSQKEELVEAQNALMFYLRDKSINASYPVKTMRGDYYAKIKWPVKPFDFNGQTHIVRLLVYMPGTELKQTLMKPPLLFEVGTFLGKLNEALKGFSHPFYETHTSIWHLESVPQIKSMTKIVKNIEKRQVVDDVIEKFIQVVLPKTNDFEKGMIHGDFNEHNIIVSADHKISAVVDFGDSHQSNYVFELAVALCYMMLECERSSFDPVVAAGHVIAGYTSIRPSFFVDFDILKICICARLCQSLVLGLKAHSINPSNDYVLDSQKHGWSVLEELWEMSGESLTRVWSMVISQRR